MATVQITTVEIKEENSSSLKHNIHNNIIEKADKKTNDDGKGAENSKNSKFCFAEDWIRYDNSYGSHNFKGLFLGAVRKEDPQLYYDSDDDKEEDNDTVCGSAGREVRV